MRATVTLGALLLLPLARAACTVAGYSQPTGDGGDCFKFITTSLTFNDAEAACVADGGHLASIHSDDEAAAIMPLIGSKTAFVGIKCTSDTACTWTDGTDYDWDDAFIATHPDMTYGNCAFFNNKHLSSWNCELGQPYLCRMKEGAAPGGCADGYAAYLDSCFAVKTATKTFADAENDCLKEGGHLASIHAIQDNVFIQQLVVAAKVTKNLFIGLKYVTDKYVWTDRSSFEEADYKNFADDFPNTRYGDCVQFTEDGLFGDASTWMNVFCDAKLAYICKRGTGPTPTLTPMQCARSQLFEDAGTFYSPGYPVGFLASAQCQYSLSGEVGTQVELSFPEFDIDAGSSIVLYDGLDFDAPLSTLTGSNAIYPNTSFVSQTNILTAIFYSSKAPSGTGWQAEFVTYPKTTPAGTTAKPKGTTAAPPPSSGCPSENYATGDTLYSPNFPSNYPPNANCIYNVASTTSGRIVLTFGDVDLENNFDRVKVYDGDSVSAQQLSPSVTGSHKAGELRFTSTGSRLTLVFTSDDSNQGMGFSAAASDF